MIKTKDIERFTSNINGAFGYSPDETTEYQAEIVARLQAYDELKEGIEKMVKRVRGWIEEASK